MAGTPGPPSDVVALVDADHTGEPVRLPREAYLDPLLFELELDRIFESTWVYLALDTELPQPHDFLTRHIGRQPVLLTRARDGDLHAFLNSCRHRGMLLCRERGGNRRRHVCPYHGWSYDSSGRGRVAGIATGAYPSAFEASDHDLVPIARLDSYRGFVFGSLNPDVPTLGDHLGEAARMLDLVADQGPRGLEVIPGNSSYTFEGNWKLQFENGLDAYHFPTTHAAFGDIVGRRPVRESRTWARGFPTNGDEIASGTISFARGHALSWSLGAPGQDPANRPLPQDQNLFETVRRQVGDSYMDWMLRQRNLTVFPNLQIVDIQSLQLRTWEPLAVDRTRMHSYCLAPLGEDAAARRFRIRQYEEFFNAGGLATSDDNVMYELNQAGLTARAAGPVDGFQRGMTTPAPPAHAYQALGLHQANLTYSTAGLAFGDESGIRSGYREWLRLLDTKPAMV